VLPKDFQSGQIEEFDTHDHVNFILPRVGAGAMLSIADGHDEPNLTRWNRAKVSPAGETWLVSITYNVLPHSADDVAESEITFMAQPGISGLLTPLFAA
jgi:hypothetical protein